MLFVGRTNITISVRLHSHGLARAKSAASNITSARARNTLDGSCDLNIKLPPLKLDQNDQGIILYKVPVRVLTSHPCTWRNSQYKSSLRHWYGMVWYQEYYGIMASWTFEELKNFKLETQ